MARAHTEHGAAAAALLAYAGRDVSAEDDEADRAIVGAVLFSQMMVDLRAIRKFLESIK